MSDDALLRARSTLDALARLFERFLSEKIVPYIRERAVEQAAAPIIYSLTAGGKRIRPALCLLAAGVAADPAVAAASPAAAAAGQAASSAAAAAADQAALLGSSGGASYTMRALHAAAALEAIHTYSLIHDDLPAMDNDSMRRGRPACHVAFPEWAAILAGDALNTLAFELVLEAAPPGPAQSKLSLLLARAAGIGGIICGQALDLHAEKNALFADVVNAGDARGTIGAGTGAAGGDARGVAGAGTGAKSLLDAKSFLDELHAKKTGALIRASCEMGAVIAGCDSADSYRRYGEGLGLLFQITDDILDITGDATTLGKTAGKDEAQGKLTYPAVRGLDQSRADCERLARELTALARELPLGHLATCDTRETLAALPELLRVRVC